MYFGFFVGNLHQWIHCSILLHWFPGSLAEWYCTRIVYHCSQLVYLLGHVPFNQNEMFYSDSIPLSVKINRRSSYRHHEKNKGNVGSWASQVSALKRLSSSLYLYLKKKRQSEVKHNAPIFEKPPRWLAGRKTQMTSPPVGLSGIDWYGKRIRVNDLILI